MTEGLDFFVDTEINRDRAVSLVVDIGDKVQLMKLKRITSVLLEDLEEENSLLERMPQDWDIQKIKVLCQSLCEKIDRTIVSRLTIRK